MAERNWPPPQGLCTPTVSAANCILQLSSSVIVNAPAAVIWDVLLDTFKYGEWNTFCPRVTIHSQPDESNPRSTRLQKGTSMTFDAVMNPSKPESKSPTQLVVTDVSTPQQHSTYVSDELLQQGTFTPDLNTVYRISWKVQGGFASRGLKSERFHEIVILAENECEVRSWETMGGILARAVKWTYGGVLPMRFQEWAETLKQRSEEVAEQATKKS